MSLLNVERIVSEITNHKHCEDIKPWRVCNNADSTLKVGPLWNDLLFSHNYCSDSLHTLTCNSSRSRWHASLRLLIAERRGEMEIFWGAFTDFRCVLMASAYVWSSSAYVSYFSGRIGSLASRIVISPIRFVTVKRTKQSTYITKGLYFPHNIWSSFVLHYQSEDSPSS